MSFCEFWGVLGLYDAWFVVIIVQCAFIGVYAGLYAACFRKTKYVTVWHLAVMYFNTSFWWWIIWILIWHLGCGFDLDR